MNTLKKHIQIFIVVLVLCLPFLSYADESLYGDYNLDIDVEAIINPSDVCSNEVIPVRERPLLILCGNPQEFELDPELVDEINSALASKNYNDDYDGLRLCRHIPSESDLSDISTISRQKSLLESGGDRFAEGCNGVIKWEDGSITQSTPMGAFTPAGCLYFEGLGVIEAMAINCDEDIDFTYKIAFAAFATTGGKRIKFLPKLPESKIKTAIIASNRARREINDHYLRRLTNSEKTKLRNALTEIQEKGHAYSNDRGFLNQYEVHSINRWMNPDWPAGKVFKLSGGMRVGYTVVNNGDAIEILGIGPELYRH